MLAQFKKRIQNGERPKHAVRINFRKRGPIYFPLEDTITFQQHFSRVLYQDTSASRFYDYTAKVAASNDRVISTFDNGDFVWLGLSVKFTGLKAIIDSANTAASVLSAEYYSDAANDYAKVTNLIDKTDSGGDTLAQTGQIVYDDPGIDWLKSTVAGHEYYWIRLSVDANCVSLEIDEIRINGAQWGYDIYNKCLIQVGEKHQEFNLDVLNYGDTIGNNNIVFRYNDEISELIFQENWKNLFVQIIQYYADYEAGEEQDIVIASLGGLQMIASYNFANTEENNQHVSFMGLTNTPSINTDSVSVSCDSLQSYWLKTNLPSYLINSIDFPRCPSSNLGKPAPINVCSNGIERPIVKVDEGASAILAADYDDETTTLAFESLENWQKFWNKQSAKVIYYKREKMRVISMNTDPEISTMTVERGYANTFTESLSEGDTVYEYLPTEQYVMSFGTIPTDQDLKVITINPDDDREQWTVPASWYQTIYNTDINGTTLNWIDTIRPIKGYFPSTQENDKELRTSQDGVYPDQSVEPRSAITQVTGSFTCIYLDTEMQWQYHDRPITSGTFTINEGWTNENAMLGSSAECAEFYGTTLGSKKHYMALQLIPSFSSEAWTAYSIQKCLKVITQLADLPPTDAFYYRANVNNDPYTEPEAGYFEDTYLSTFGEFYQTLFYGSPIANWKTIDNLNDLNEQIDIFVSEYNYLDMSQGLGGKDWQSARGKIQQLFYEIRVKDNMWDDDDLTNGFDGNTATVTEATGVFSDRTNEFHKNFYLAYNWQAKPSGNLQILRKQLVITFYNEITATDTNQSFKLTWDTGSVHGAPIEINLSDLTLNATPGNKYTIYVDVNFNPTHWDSRVDCDLYTCLDSETTVGLYNVQLIVEYLSDTGTISYMWTDDEQYPGIGSILSDLEFDGIRSYAWLKYNSLKDGVMMCWCTPRELNYGLVKKVYLQVTCQIKPFDTNNSRGGCVKNVNGGWQPSAWAWYGHINQRSGAYTGTTGNVTIATVVFTDDSATFETWGVQTGDILYYDDDGVDLDNQGTYVILSVDSETQLTIDAYNTHLWDVGKEDWTGFAATRDTDEIKYRIHRPFELDQTGDQITQEFDITDMMSDWNPDTDFQERIYIRSHNYSDTQAVEIPLYDYDENYSLHRVWMPKIRLIYNGGREALVFVKGLSGIGSGTDNPATGLNEIMTDSSMLYIDSDFIDSDSQSTIEANLTTRAAKIDLCMDVQKSFKEWLQDFTFPFGYQLLWGERAKYVDGSTIKVLDDTVISSQPFYYTSSIQEQQWEDDYVNDSQAAKSTVYGTEANATTGWTYTNCSALETEQSTPSASGAGDYNLKFTSSGGEIDLILTFAAPILVNYNDNWKIEAWMKGDEAKTCNFKIIGLDFGGSEQTLSVMTDTISTGWKKHAGIYTITENLVYISRLEIRISDTSIDADFRIAVITLLRSRQLFGSVQRDNRISNPLAVVGINNIYKWGPLFTQIKLAYNIKPWIKTTELATQNGRGAVIIESGSSDYFSSLQSNYGVIPYPDSLQKLHMISNKTTAERHFSWLQRFLSERWVIELDLGHYGTQLEIGDIIFVGTVRDLPQHYKGEYNFDRYMQVISTNGQGIVTLIEVNENFGDALI